MNGTLAILICLVGIAGLFYLDRDKTARTSRAFWVPVIWLALAGSKPTSEWFGMSNSGLASSVDGSPFDAAVYGVLLLAGITILFLRRSKTTRFLPLLIPIVIFALYSFISVTWSPVPASAVKRWSKDFGDMVMVLVIATEIDPVYALRRLFSRIGFVLLPLSIVFIRYTTLGRGWDAFGAVANVGVSNNKNSLGLTVYVLSLGALWNIRALILDKKGSNRSRHLIAQGTLLASGVALLATAHSSTSVACFGLGSILMLATGLRAIGTKPIRVHVLCLGILITGTLALLMGGTGDVAGALGRQSTLTGRTDIWAAVIPTVPNALIGAGFDSFWNSHGAELFAENLNTNSHWFHAERINEAHDGYIEVYLNLGWIGVSLIALLLITGYGRACKAFRRNPEVASLMLAYIITAAFYNITEAGFRTLNLMWIFVLLSIVIVSGVNGGLIESNVLRIRRTRLSKGMDSSKAQVFSNANEDTGYGTNESKTPISVGRAMFGGVDSGWSRSKQSPEELPQRQ